MPSNPKQPRTTTICGRPQFNHVKIYFDQKGLPQKAAEVFYKHYECRKWKTEKGSSITNWKTVANNWIWMHQQASRPQMIEVKLRLLLPSGVQTSCDGR